MIKFREYIKSLEINVLKDLLEQYEWETKCNLDNHLDKMNLIKKELKFRTGVVFLKFIR
ncbi:MAG: hypothetical protein ACLR3R_18740 [Clostridium paraputrificum]